MSSIGGHHWLSVFNAKTGQSKEIPVDVHFPPKGETCLKKIGGFWLLHSSNRHALDFLEEQFPEERDTKFVPREHALVEQLSAISKLQPLAMEPSALQPSAHEQGKKKANLRPHLPD